MSVKKSSRSVFVLGGFQTDFSRNWTKEAKHIVAMMREAVQGALETTRIEPKEIEVAHVGNFAAELYCMQGHLGAFVLEVDPALRGLPTSRHEAACASGSIAALAAAADIEAGRYDVALVLGAEKMNIADKQRAFSIFEAGWDVSRADENFATLAKMGEGVEVPPGTESDRPYSRFMAIYAAMCRYHMKTYGTTQRQIAAVSAKNHGHSVHNPYSQFRKAFTIEEILAAPPITYPITLPMCAPLSDGAAAAILGTDEGLARIGADRSRCIRIAASAVSYTHLRAHETVLDIVCRLLLEKKKEAKYATRQRTRQKNQTQPTTLSLCTTRIRMWHRTSKHR